MIDNLKAANSDISEGITTPMKINLQLFAEGDPTPASDPEPSPNPEPAKDPVPSDPTPNNDPIPTPQPSNEPTQTQAFAHRLKEETQKARDAVIAELGYQYNGKPITTYAEYQQALKEQQAAEEAQKLNIDPDFYNEFVGLKDKVTQFETEKQRLEQEKIFVQQDTALKNDPVKGELYKQWETDVKSQAKALNTDLNTAFLLMLDTKLADVLTGTKTKAEQEAIHKITTNGASSPGSLAEGGEGSKTFFTREEVKAMSQSEVSKNYSKIVESMKKW